MDPRWGSTRVENPAFSPTHETRRVSATNAVCIKDCRVVAGITIARTEKKGCKDESKTTREGDSVLKGLIRVRLADSSGEVILVEKGMTGKRPAAS